MKAVEIMGTVNEQGQLCLDTPLSVTTNTRVKIIVLLSEEEELTESAQESFRQGWQDVMTGNTLPVSQL
jgi:hypothetical protein